MQKYLKLLISINIIPEAIALTIVFNTVQTTGLFYICSSLIIYSLILRFIWNSAIIVHGLGHTIAIALADRELSAFSLTNILENQSIEAVLISLLPGNQIFIPLLSSHCFTTPLPYLASGNPHQIRLKAIGGIFLNLFVAIVFFLHFQNLFSQTLIVANLLIALSSLSDLQALTTGIADRLYCGNFGLIAQRKPEDKDSLLPARMLKIAQQMGYETEVRGAQAGGGLVIGEHGDRTVFVGKKKVNRKRNNLTKSLEANFALTRNKAILAGVKPLKSSVMGVWHYRYATSGAIPSELETHWHEWMSARNEEVWQFMDEQWSYNHKNVHHCITHNGDFDSWSIFNQMIDTNTLGLWLERVLHTPNATKGDSPKIAGMMDLLVTKGMWYPSVRLAYQQAIATSIEDAFDEQQPTAAAPNTAPSDRDLNTWAEIFKNFLTLEWFGSEPFNSCKINHASLKSSICFQEHLVQALKSHSSTINWSELQTINFIQSAIGAFIENDLYRATQIFISQAQGSFGLVTTSTLKESEIVICAKGQPMTVGLNMSQGYILYASEPAAVDRVLLNQPQSFRLDLEQKGGEVAKIRARQLTVYSLSQQQELSMLDLKDRWISMTDHPYLSQIQFTARKKDPVADDINSIPRVLQEITTDWQNSTSLNRRSADYLTYLLTKKVEQFEKKKQIMFEAGLIDKPKALLNIDLLITGEENSLWLGEKFAEDLKVVFPFLNVVTISANQILQQLGRNFCQLNLDKDSLILAITQSGQTFSTVQVINVFDRLCSQGVIGELFILTGELSSFINSVQGKGGLKEITNSSCLNHNSDHRDRNLDSPFNAGNPRNGLSRIFVNGSRRRIAEASTVTVAAAGQTLTELLLYLAKQIRHSFPNSRPLGMSLTAESLKVLIMMKKDFLNKNIIQIIGATAQGELIPLNSRHTLIQNGRFWAKHIVETPLAWAIQALYILISVGWVIPFGHTQPLVKTLSDLILKPVLPQGWSEIIAPIITLADIAVYIFGVWLWTLAIRYFQGRQLFARMGKRTLVIGDVFWVNKLLESYVSKLFSLSYGICTIEVHGENPQNHLLHAFGHRVVRGTLIWLGIPDGRRSKQHEIAENAVIMTGKQANGVKNFKFGAEIVAVGQNPAIASHGFSQSLVFNSNKDSVYFRNPAVVKQKEQIEQLRESCFGSFERLLAGYIFFWALAKKVASFPFLKYEYWKSQSRTNVMTTATPVSGIGLDELADIELGELAL
jgi:hypothetical protein